MRSMKYLLAIVLALGLMLGLCACGEGSEKNTTDPVQTTDAATDSTGTTDETKTEQTPTYTVKVVDEGGNPITNVLVQLCNAEGCHPALTDENGVAEFFMEEDSYEVKFVKLPSGYEYSTEETVFHFADGSNELTITLKAVG